MESTEMISPPQWGRPGTQEADRDYFPSLRFVGHGRFDDIVNLDLFSRKLPEQDRARRDDPDADQLPGSEPAPIVDRGVIAAINFHEGPEHGIKDQIKGKNLAVEFFAAIEPRQEDVQRQVQKRIINLRGMESLRAVI